MSAMTLEGYVEHGQIRLLDSAAALPERTKVYIVVPDAPAQVYRIWSPRLADPGQISEFSIEVTELPASNSDA